MKTKAAVLYETGKPLAVEEVEIPGLLAGQVLVRVAYSGVCHSQLNEIKGLRGPDKFLPHTLGHEGAGSVVKVGHGVNKVKAGDSVVLTWIKGFGSDVPSCAYKNKETQINSGAISTFMNLAVVSENRVVPISPDMPLDKAALLGCAVPTGCGIIFNTLKPSAGSSIAIFGVGGIGMSAVVAASVKGCSPIIAVDIHEKKLKKAVSLGAHKTINALRQDPVQEILNITSAKGVDFAIESAGLKQTMENAYMVVKDNGGVLVIAGNLAHKEKISIDPYDLIKGKRIIGSWAGQTNPDQNIPRYAQLYLDGKLPLDEMVSRSFRLDEVNLAVESLEKDEAVTRLLLDCNA